MPVLDPTLSLSSRQEAFRNHYYENTRVSMSFHDTPQQPARPAGVVPDGAKRRSGTSGGPPEDNYNPERSSRKRADGERPSEEERAEGAETDWLYQRRNNYTELHDPWSPENIERRRRDSLNRLERAGPFNPPRNAGSAPDHDIS